MASQASNSSSPLLNPALPIAFDKIRAEDIEPTIDSQISQANSALDTIAEKNDKRTFSNTLESLERLGDHLEFSAGLVSHLESVATTPALREAYLAIQPKLASFSSGIPLNTGVWETLQQYSSTTEAKQLQGAKARLLEKTLRDFRRHGAGLIDDQKQQLQEIDIELADLSTKFSNNSLDATNDFKLDILEESQLEGLPVNAREAAHELAQKNGVSGWRFNLRAPSVIPVMTYLQDRSIRKHIWLEYNRRASKGEWDNRPIITRMLELRLKKAKLLGYQNFADLILEDRMAGTGAKAQAFVQDLTRRTQPFFVEECESLKAFRKEIEGPQADTIEPWDVGYYAEKQRRALYDFDEEELRPYFVKESVLEGLFSLAKHLYGISIEANPNLPRWHENVQAFDMREESGQAIGTFYTDFSPRESKRDGAWMHGLVQACPNVSWANRQIGVICGTLSDATADRPAMLSHHEVETIFHEFGHLLHHMLTKVDIRSLAGANVAWDFVELPSQIMENWCWEREALDLFARHYKTNEVIPNELFNKMTRARNYRSAAATMRQLGFAQLDLALHTDYDPQRDGEILRFAREQLAPYSAAPVPDDYAMICSFSHLFASPVAYAAGYYSYKWAEVLDADAFSAFQKGGLFSRTVGEKFRADILAKGDSEDPMELFKCFMGREPDLNALLRRSGLLNPVTSNQSSP